MDGRIWWKIYGTTGVRSHLVSRHSRWLHSNRIDWTLNKLKKWTGKNRRCDPFAIEVGWKHRFFFISVLKSKNELKKNWKYPNIPVNNIFCNVCCFCFLARTKMDRQGTKHKKRAHFKYNVPYNSFVRRTCLVGRLELEMVFLRIRPKCEWCRHLSTSISFK